MLLPSKNNNENAVILTFILISAFCKMPKSFSTLISLLQTESGAGEGNRTLVWSLENSRSTIELRPPCLSSRSRRRRLTRSNTKTPALALSTAAR